MEGAQQSNGRWLSRGWSLERSRPILLDGAALGSVLFLAAVESFLPSVTCYWFLKRVEAAYLSLTSFINPIVP